MRCKINSVIIIVVAIIVTIISDLGYAQYITGPVAGATGGAGRGAADDAEQFLLNPAAVAHGTTSSSMLFYQGGYTAEHERDQVMGAALTDNSEDILFSGALMYLERQSSFEDFADYEEKFINFSIAKFAAKYLSFGMALTYRKTDMLEQDQFFILDDSYQQIDIDIGILYNPLPDLGVGVTVLSLLPRDEEVPIYVQNKDVIGAGVYYIFSKYFRGRFDLLTQMVYNPDNKFHYQGGVESHLNRFLIFRLGADIDDLPDRKYGTLGLGFAGPRVSLDYSLKVNTNDTQSAMHGVDFRMPFW